MKYSASFKPLTLSILGTFALASSVSVWAQNSDDDVVQLDNIVVSASGSEQLVEDAPASITVVSRQDLEKKAFKDVTDMLKDVPGVNITGGGSSSDISIRGMAPQYTMILVDGKRQNSRETRPNSDGPGIEQGWMPPLQAIERVEVIRGPMSSLYGSDAMGGVVNIITRKVPKEWTGGIRNEMTIQEDRDSGDMYESNLYLGGPIIEDKLGIQIFGQKSYRQEDHIVNGFNKQDKTSGTVKLAFTPNEDHDFVAEASRTLQDRFANPGRSMEAVNPRNNKPNQPSLSKYHRNNYSLTHTGHWGDLTTDTYLQHSKTSNPVRDMYYKNTEFDTKWSLPLGDHFLTAGFNYQKEKLTDFGNEYNPNVNGLTRYQWAMFAEDEWMITDDFSLTGGLRMTHDENYGNHWTPRLYAVWHATDQLTFKGGVSTGFKAPGLRQTVAEWGQITGGANSAVPAIIMGNPDLKPEKSVSQELSMIWDNLEGLSAGLTFFNTQFKDKISEVRRCQDPNELPNCHVMPGDIGYKFISDRVNVDKAVMRGIEATTSWQALDNLKFSANYTYTYSKQKSGQFAGKPLNKTPKHMINATADWDPTEKLNVWSRVNFRGKSSEYLSRTAMAESTPSYTFVDAGVNYKINKKVSVGLGVYNVFNKRVDNEDYEATYDGRRYWLQLSANF